MTSLDPIPGLSGLVGIVTGVLVVATVMTLLVDSLVHWLPVLLGLAVGIMAVKAING